MGMIYLAAQNLGSNGLPAAANILDPLLTTKLGDAESRQTYVATTPVNGVNGSEAIHGKDPVAPRPMTIPYIRLGQLVAGRHGRLLEVVEVVAQPAEALSIAHPRHNPTRIISALLILAR